MAILLSGIILDCLRFLGIGGNKSYDVSLTALSVPSGLPSIRVCLSVPISLIYNEYYRDQNLTEPIDFTLGSGTTGWSVIQLHALHHVRLRRRAWEKDYFTSALPWLQRGPEVTVPVQGVWRFYGCCL